MILTVFFQYPGLAIGIVATLLGLGFLVFRWSKQGMLTLDYLKMLFGFALLVMIVLLAALTSSMAAVQGGREELTQILTMLSVLSGAFAQWAFSNKEEHGKSNGSDPSKR